MARGRFITLEGGEGVGKSTQLAALAEALRARGLTVVTTREPGGSEGAEAIRRLLLEGGEERWSAPAEALLFAAARTDHVDKIVRPAILGGQWVLSDRFVDSSLAYQGGAGGLGIEAVRAVNAFGIEGWFPDRTLLLLHPEGAERARARDGAASDRIGGRPASYHQAVEESFRAIAAAEPERVRLIDASGTPEEVTARLLAALGDLL
ncbi:dTMP kinase [Sphingomonas astaxanthinifaciens]|uniref:Thymidylate kinase n=1 Tax=Sphingomonas astaxanthinifaciens DSM 22298 TaxID=1123267 RepID=A0ABQ5Z6V9_9SPHN|nr:dTMP kinase [Sphingomonas astaxanthinifaciens]GLR47719.1 thymidylate kinase [Sphingomonas astaxanthinifaciens DSM 22298]